MYTTASPVAALEYSEDGITISLVDVIRTEESVKSRLPVDNSLFVILIVEVVDTLEQDPNDEEIVELGSQSTDAVAACVS